MHGTHKQPNGLHTSVVNLKRIYKKRIMYKVKIKDTYIFIFKKEFLIPARALPHHLQKEMYDAVTNTLICLLFITHTDSNILNKL